tara:strand:+ start:195 stop:500 length:306 start_codon:yes stop_codon:yes gene_type:complete
MALRLSTQLALSRSSVTLTAAQVAALEDIFGLITQDGRSFLLSQNETKLLLQLADKNVMITQSGDALLTQSGGNIFIDMDFLYTQNRNLLQTEAGEDLNIG